MAKEEQLPRKEKETEGRGKKRGGEEKRGEKREAKK